MARSTVGILTFHRCFNYGSYWQARCLLEGLRERGIDAVILNHDSQQVNAAEWKCGLQPVLPTPVPKQDHLLYGVKLLKFLRAFSALPYSARFTLEAPAAMEKFELVIVGSDEVWNLRHPWYGGCPLFYGAGLRAGRLASYAASFGNYHASEGLAPTWADHLRRFAAISVRDDNSRHLVRSALGTDPEMVLDPCLQFLPRPEGRWRGPGYPYAAVYGHNFSASFVREAKRWARARGLPLISIGYRNAWADRQWVTAGPHEFAHFIAHAEAVVTNFFHGCVFALRNGRPFACESSAYRSVKVHNLMATVGGESHLIEPETPSVQFDACLEGPLSPGILQRIDTLRQSSRAYLDRVLA